jgi:hypothetical protein
MASVNQPDDKGAVTVAGKIEQYDTWQQVGGYFDGDGNVGLEVVKYVLRFRIRFSDTWKLQIVAVKSFMNGRGIATTNITHERHKGKRDAFRIDIGELVSALKAAKSMLPYCVKKAEDLEIMIEYLEGKITGNQAIERFNEEVRIGRRSGFIRNLSLPYLRKEGLRLSQLENTRKARAAHAVNVSGPIRDSIRKDHKELKMGHIRPSKKYGYSVHVIRRVLGAP